VLWVGNHYEAVAWVGQEGNGGHPSYAIGGMHPGFTHWYTKSVTIPEISRVKDIPCCIFAPSKTCFALRLIGITGSLLVRVCVVSAENETCSLIWLKPPYMFTVLMSLSTV
jgi:hypothetical protein